MNSKRKNINELNPFYLTDEIFWETETNCCLGKKKAEYKCIRYRVKPHFGKLQDLFAGTKIDSES